MSGTVDRYAKVVVTPRATPTAAPRQGRYWSDELAVANGPLSPATIGTPWRAPLSIYYSFASSPGGQDIVRLDTRMAQIPGNPEAMTYDGDIPYRDFTRLCTFRIGGPHPVAHTRSAHLLKVHLWK